MLTRASIHTQSPQDAEESTSRDAPAQPKPDDRNPHAVALGRLGAVRGGQARTRRLTPAQRSDIARRAAAARWSTPLGPDGRPVIRQPARGARRKHEFTVKGQRLVGTRAQVERVLRGVPPEPIERHFVEVKDVRYPVKQALALAFGLPRHDFDGAWARAILLRMGLQVGSLPPEGSGPPDPGGVRPRFPRASGLPRPERTEAYSEDGEAAAQVQAIEVPPIVLAWSPWHRWKTLREDERGGPGLRLPAGRPGVYEVMAEGQGLRLTIGRTSNLRARVKYQLVMGSGGSHPAREPIMKNEDLGRVFIRWALTDRPAAAEEALHLDHVRRHGRLPKYTQRT
jgi:hypothetical protein